MGPVKRDSNPTVHALNMLLSKCSAALTSLGSIKESVLITSENTALAPVPRRRLGRFVF